MDKIFLYTLVFLVVILIVILAYFLLDKILRIIFLKQKKEPSLAEPIIKALTVLGIAYAGQNELAIPLINACIEFINNKYKAGITLINRSETKINPYITIIFY